MQESKANLVRYSRAGDHYHYTWAARRCLKLLDMTNDLVAVTIEGISDSENDDSGEEIVDVAEYYGSESLEECRRVVYYQIKHSTVNVNLPWTLSRLKKTVEGFYKRFNAHKNGVSDINHQNAEFIFLTNRPVSQTIHTLLQRIKSKSLIEKDNDSWAKLKEYLSTQSDEEAYEFLNNFYIVDANDGLWQQRNRLKSELGEYLPGPDRDAAEQVWRLVSEKALPEHSHNPSITREDVLRVLNTDETKLFPAHCIVEEDSQHFAREQEGEILKLITENDGTPIIVHADGGVGKTALAKRLCDQISEQNVAILYDCFGRGEYRNPVKRRHEHHTGLVQIANELAAKGLCDPLIQSRQALNADYLKAFTFRLKQAVALLNTRLSTGKLVIFIDAADNAQLAADEFGDRTSFPKDLIRLEVPDGIVLVFLCRTHRVPLLNPPHDSVKLCLKPFSLRETRIFLRQNFPDATDNDVNEFHHLTSRNPRVQSVSLSNCSSLVESLSALGPQAASPEDAIRAVFQKSMDRLLDSVPDIEAEQFRTVCLGLSSFRPFVPLDVLSKASGIPIDAIRSFATDLGQPLSIRGDAVQFNDEPSETWFRETYKPTREKLAGFIEAIKPLATENSYVASALPQLMLEAGQYNKLVSLALTDQGLPSENPVERRNAMFRRLQFALKAALRKFRYEDAAKLALKAGGESAGDDRRQKLVQENTDLASRLLPDNQLLEIVARKKFTTKWFGGHHAYEAALLSGHTNTVSESRGYLRLTYRWILHWSRLPKNERRQSSIDIHDIAEIALAQMNIEGSVMLVRELENWKPKQVAYQAGRMVFSRLVDLGRFDKLDEIASVSKTNLGIQLALIHAQNSILRYPTPELVRVVMSEINEIQDVLPRYDAYSREDQFLSVLTSVAQAAAFQKSVEQDKIASVLEKHTPKFGKSDVSHLDNDLRFAILKANCLCAALANKEIAAVDLEEPNLSQSLENEHYNHELLEFRDEIKVLFSWHKLWTKALLGNVDKDDLITEIEDCMSSFPASTYAKYSKRKIYRDICRLWVEIVLLVEPSEKSMEKFTEWTNSLNQQLSIADLTYLARLCSRSTKLQTYTFKFASEAYELIDREQMDAEYKVSSYSRIARAVFTTSVAPNNPKPELAYRFSRFAEVAYNYLAREDYFDWETTIDAITHLCPASSLTILSRWRDRNFGSDALNFPVALKYLVNLNEIKPAAQLACQGFRYNWDVVTHLENTLSTHSDREVQKRIFDETVRYMLIRGISKSELEKCIEIGGNQGWATGYLEPYLNFAISTDASAGKTRSEESINSEPDEKSREYWHGIFADANVESSNSIAKAYQRMRESDPPYIFSEFTKNLFERVVIGQEISAATAIFKLSAFRLYYLQDVFDAIPESWLQQQSFRTSLKNSVESICLKNYYDITKTRFYQPIPFDTINDYTGITEREIYRIAIEAHAENPNLLDSHRLFNLVNMITQELSTHEAERVLRFGLDLLETEIDEKDGDGDWHESISPPRTAHEALAGYIWSALAAPRVATRWEAAHTVCLLCSFKQTDVLNFLLDLALGNARNPYHDKTLSFYELSAKQWLLMALVRAVQKNCDSVAIFENLLRQECQLGQRHAIIRELAAMTLLELRNCTRLQMADDEITRMKNINLSKLDVVDSRVHDRNFEKSKFMDFRDDAKYHFQYDLSRYWFGNLGKIFAIGSDEIAERAERVITGEWNVKCSNGRAEDRREKIGIFKNMKAYHSHGLYPRTENLDFYYSYHSMMIIAGKLIDSVQRYQDPDNQDELEEWLTRHGLTRSDGLWLADRRDPNPPVDSAWKCTEESDEWPFSVMRSDLDSVSYIGADNSCVWGSWVNSSGSRIQRTSINSALIKPENSDALLRALQTAPDASRYVLPTSGGEQEIDYSMYQLSGWILNYSDELGIDEFDPWSGEIRYPTLRPADWFIEKFGLISDYEKRLWYCKGQKRQVLMRSEIWGYKDENEHYYTPESGERILINKEFLTKCLASLGKELIFEVQIEREYSRNSYHFDRNSDFLYIPPYTLIFIFKSDGTIRTI